MPAAAPSRKKAPPALTKHLSQARSRGPRYLISAGPKKQDPAYVRGAAPVLWTRLFVVIRRLSQRPGCFLHQVGLDEGIEIAIEHAVRIANFEFRAVVFHHLIGMQHVAANLVAECDLLLRAADLIELRLVFLHLDVEQ